MKTLYIYIYLYILDEPVQLKLFVESPEDSQRWTGEEGALIFTLQLMKNVNGREGSSDILKRGAHGLGKWGVLTGAAAFVDGGFLRLFQFDVDHVFSALVL